MKKSKRLDCQGNKFFPKTKGDSITGQDRAQKHCDFRFSQIEKKSKVAVLQLVPPPFPPIPENGGGGVWLPVFALLTICRLGTSS